MPNTPRPPSEPRPDEAAPPVVPQAAAPEATAGGDDATDPELLRIASTRKRRSPLVALAVLGLGAVLLWRLVPDLRYAGRGEHPVDLGDARALRFDSTAPLADNILATVRGLPDYRNALYFQPKGDNYRHGFYRLLGTGSRLWVRADQTSTRHDLSDHATGRLRRFDALPYAEQVRGYYATQVEATRLLDRESFRVTLAALQKSSAPDALLASLRDAAGQPLRLAHGVDEPVTVVVAFPDQVIVGYSKERFFVAEDARHEAERLGVPVGPVTLAPKSFEFPVRFDPTQRDAFLDGLSAQGIPFRPRRARLTMPLAELLAANRSATGGLAVPVDRDDQSFLTVVSGRLEPAPAPSGTQLVPWERVESIQVDAPVEIPHDAWVLVEGELPADLGWTRALVAALALFMLFDLWLLTRALARR